jgi:uncharacterized iron-regulated membrane protein
MLRVVAIAMAALIGCWFWWLKEEKWCAAFEEEATPAALTFCLPVSPFVAFSIVLISGGVILWMKFRKR